MALVHGKNTIVIVGSDDISVYTKSSELARKADTEDVTTYGKDAHVYDVGLTDATGKMEGVYDSTSGTGPRAVLTGLIGVKTTFTRRPEGTGAGLPQDVVDVVITGYTETNPVAGYITWAVDMQCSDDVDTTAQSA